MKFNKEELYFMEKMLDDQRVLLNKNLKEITYVIMTNKLYNNEFENNILKSLLKKELFEIHKSIDLVDNLRIKFENKRKRDK